MIRSLISKLFLLSFLCLIATGLFAQVADIGTKVKNEILLNVDKYNLSQKDAEEVFVIDAYTDESIGISYVYVGQKVNGIPVYNKQSTFYINAKGVVGTVASGFINTEEYNIKGQARAGLSPEAVLLIAANDLGIQNPEIIKGQGLRSEMVFESSNISQHPIEIEHVYFVEENELVPAYLLSIHKHNSMDYFQMVVGAAEGKILDKVNFNHSCKFDLVHPLPGEDLCKDERPTLIESYQSPNNGGNSVEQSTYRVFELPLEAPSFGAARLVTSPADTIASPYGWHDLDGAEGVDNSTLEGNNTFSFVDLDGNYLADTIIDGGPGLNFDFQADFNLEPQHSKAAAATNLFYMINKMHDFSYNFGFTEAAGNFQLDNYGRGGQGGDYVIGMGQFGNGEGEFANNANFLTPRDGQSGQMRMYLWSNSSNFFVLTPTTIAGGYETGDASFGTAISSTPTEADAILALDATGGGSLFCNEAKNAGEMAGKIVLIERGGCDFSLKVFNAQNAGAAGAIIMNFEEQVLGMASGSSGNLVTIPSVFVSLSTGNLMKNELSNGEVVRVKFQIIDKDGPEFLDASFDNGIIAHEYGHGISIRLTGGPSNSSCLSNGEQMGEGWSDFFSLITTRRLGDQGSDQRGIGTYSLDQNIVGRGIRRYPYSTDITRAPLTYADVANASGVHAIGEIWCNMIWDLFWAMTEKHGDDGLLIGGSGGNSMAINLVMQGLKLQPCSPGFVDGRNAILTADSLLYGGENACLIWDVFARRGLGYYASQGSSSSSTDGVADFNSYPFCLDKLAISKSVTEEVEAGGEITVSIEVTNYKLSTIQNIKVNDIIAEHTSYIAGSGGTENGNVVEFILDSLQSGEKAVVTYKAKVDADYKSSLLYLEDFNKEFDIFDLTWAASLETGSILFEFNPNGGKDGSGSYFVPNFGGEYKSFLEKLSPLTIAGENPYLVLQHSYNTIAGQDGSNIRYTENDDLWVSYTNEVERGQYGGVLAYSSFTLPNLPAFSGNSNGYVKSFVNVKAQDTKSIYLRLYFAASEGAFVEGGGWDIDNLELVDAKFVNSEACVSIEGEAPECATAPEKGTYILHNGTLSNNKPSANVIDSKIFPNPGDGQLYISWKSAVATEMTLNVLNTNGQLISSVKKRASIGVNLTSIDIAHMPAGVYFVQMLSAEGSGTVKYIKF